MITNAQMSAAQRAYDNRTPEPEPDTWLCDKCGEWLPEDAFPDDVNITTCKECLTLGLTK
jgi:hypothetical protein